MGKTSKVKRLDYKGKVRLLRSWLHHFYADTESWEPDNIGVHIAYLCKAVIHDEQIELATGSALNRIINNKDPKHKSVIWQYIELVPGYR